MGVDFSKLDELKRELAYMDQVRPGSAGPGAMPPRQYGGSKYDPITGRESRDLVPLQPGDPRLQGRPSQRPTNKLPPNYPMMSDPIRPPMYEPPMSDPMRPPIEEPPMSDPMQPPEDYGRYRNPFMRGGYNPFMSGGFGSRFRGGGFGGQPMMNPFMGGGFDGGFNPFMGGGGFNPFMGGYGGGFNPFMGGGFNSSGGGYNPFMAVGYNPFSSGFGNNNQMAAPSPTGNQAPAATPTTQTGYQGGSIF